MNIRKVHRAFGLLFGPFFVITSLTGIVLLFRKTDLYGAGTKKLLIGLHTWEIAAPYIGAILAIALLGMTCSGCVMLIQIWKRQKSTAPEA